MDIYCENHGRMVCPQCDLDRKEYQVKREDQIISLLKEIRDSLTIVKYNTDLKWKI